ncbi:hypothetical protein ZWY2020_007058 [Hordeum vulgare]|nr:hypothetical protein ZWY2020_007058 [Hordeum vulgare]
MHPSISPPLHTSTSRVWVLTLPCLVPSPSACRSGRPVRRGECSTTADGPPANSAKMRDLPHDMTTPAQRVVVWYAAAGWSQPTPYGPGPRRTAPVGFRSSAVDRTTGSPAARRPPRAPPPPPQGLALG